jgi:hypothetical protein
MQKTLGRKKGFKRAQNHRSPTKKLGGSSSKELIWMN